MFGMVTVTEALEELAATGPSPRELLHPFAAYFALGDSMSMDIYPRYDAKDRGNGELGLGAATLLHETLAYRAPQGGISGFRIFQNLTEDGAVCKDLGTQVARISPERLGLRKGEPTLVTITAGGNDLLRTLPLQSFGAAVEEMDRAIEHLSHSLYRLERRLGDYPPTILLANVYDPTDRTGELQIGGTSLDVRLQLRYLDYWNEQVFKVIAKDHPGLEVIPVDVWAHFFGHGANGRLGIGARLGEELNRCHTPNFWYWSRSWIEPGVEGARQLAGLWYRRVTKAREKELKPQIEEGFSGGVAKG